MCTNITLPLDLPLSFVTGRQGVGEMSASQSKTDGWLRCGDLQRSRVAVGFNELPDQIETKVHECFH